MQTGQEQSEEVETRTQNAGSLEKLNQQLETENQRIEKANQHTYDNHKESCRQVLINYFVIPDKFSSIMEKYIKMSSSLLMITIKEKLYKSSDSYAMMWKQRKTSKTFLVWKYMGFEHKVKKGKITLTLPIYIYMKKIGLRLQKVVL